jgi:hypothetical protein
MDEPRVRIRCRLSIQDCPQQAVDLKACHPARDMTLTDEKPYVRRVVAMNAHLEFGYGEAHISCLMN